MSLRREQEAAKGAEGKKWMTFALQTCLDAVGVLFACLFSPLGFLSVFYLRPTELWHKRSPDPSSDSFDYAFQPTFLLQFTSAF